MSTMLETIDQTDDLAELRRQDVAIASMRERYMPLTIAGIDDRKGYDAVHRARMDVKNHRVAVEKTRKALKESVLERGRLIDGEAKRITAMLEPIEGHLEAEQRRIDAEKDRIKREAEESRQRKIDERIKAMVAVGVNDVSGVSAMSDDDFAKRLQEATAAHAERQRIEAEERAARERAESEAAEARRIEAEALAIERKRLDEIAAKQKAEQDRIDAERRKLEARQLAERQRVEAEERERQRLADLEKARVEAAERARVETEQRLAREAENERRRLEAEAAAKAKAEAERPYREKLLALAATVSRLDVPEGPCSPNVLQILGRAAKQISDLAAGDIE